MVFLEECSDPDVVFEIPGEAIDLVDDHVSSAGVRELRQHALKLRSVGSLRGVAPIDILPNEAPATLRHESSASLELRRPSSTRDYLLPLI